MNTTAPDTPQPAAHAPAPQPVPPLLPCPFCGRAPVTGVAVKGRIHFVECGDQLDCPCSPMAAGSTLAVAAANWNTRKGGTSK